jgi:hypothetical protein
VPGRRSRIPVRTGARVAVADPGRLSDLLAKLNDGRKRADALAVSSKTGLGLLTVAATEAAGGLKVGINWLAEPDDVAKLLGRMRTGPDDKVGRRVINALDPVRDALPPAAAIKTPNGGAQLGAGAPFSSGPPRTTTAMARRP